MKHRILLFVTLSALAVPLFTAGCEQTIKQDKKVTVHDDGSTTVKEKTVKQEPDGSVKQSDETKKTPPPQQ